jgi:hypothetical protein
VVGRFESVTAYHHAASTQVDQHARRDPTLDLGLYLGWRAPAKRKGTAPPLYKGGREGRAGHEYAGVYGRPDNQTGSAESRSLGILAVTAHRPIAVAKGTELPRSSCPDGGGHPMGDIGHGGPSEPVASTASLGRQRCPKCRALATVQNVVQFAPGSST